MGRRQWRIPGPEGCIDVIFPTLQNSDERDPLRIRPVNLSTGILALPDGSAYHESGNSKIMCAVYGPKTIPPSSNAPEFPLSIHVQLAPFSGSAYIPYGRSDIEGEIALIVQQAVAPAVCVHLLPKSIVQVYIIAFFTQVNIKVIQSDGINSLIASAVIATSLALADAGIEMYDLVSACSAGFLDNEIVLDCDQREQDMAQGSLIMAYMPKLNQVTHIIQSGGTLDSVSELVKAMDLCIDACTAISCIQTESLVV